MSFVMRLRSVGNPDFGQYAPVSEPETVEGETLAEMRDHCERYIEKWDLGGGNWVDPVVKDKATGKAVGRFSYNRRLWTMQKWPKCSEIKIDAEVRS